MLTRRAGRRDRSRELWSIKSLPTKSLFPVAAHAVYGKPLNSLPAADAYVFDIDGTLLVTRDLVHWNALHQAMLEAYGVDATIEGIPYHGMTDLSILRAALTRAGISGSAFESLLPKALEVVCREVDANRAELQPHVCPGIPGLLQQLKAHGYLLGIASGNLETVGWHKIESAGLRQFFSFGCFSDQCEPRSGIFQSAVDHVRERLGPGARTCFVGDTPADVRAAREIGAQIVAVATGTFSLNELSACSPDICVSNCGNFVEQPG
jgi:phosphoglycolate phosphatase